MTEYTALAAVLGVGPFSAMPQTPELRRELSTLRRQIRTGAADQKIILTIRRITMLRTRAIKAEAWNRQTRRTSTTARA